MHRHLKTGLAAACLVVSVAARADDTDVDVFGPTARSSIALFQQASRARADEVAMRDGSLLGHVRQHGDATVVSGLWAIDPRLNLTASLGDDHLHATLDNGVAQQSQSSSGTDLTLGASAWLMGDARVAGFGLAATGGFERHVQQPNRVGLALQPQWRVDETLVASGVFGVHEAVSHGAGAVATAALYVAWRPSAEFSLVPAVGVERFPARNTYTASQSVWLGVSATWHVDAHWALSLDVDGNRQTDRNTSFYVNDVHSARGVNGELGARYTF